MQSAAARVKTEEELASDLKQKSSLAASKKSEIKKEVPSKKEPTVITVDLEDLGEDTYNSFNRRYEYLGQPRNRALVPTIFADVMRNCVIYILIFAVTVLCIYKVIQVQNTRQLTATLNEVNLNIETQSRESLLLQAQRQSLSAHASVREQAIDKLGMVNPKTEAEVVIRLDN